MLLDQVLSNLEPDEEILESVRQQKLKSTADQKKSKNSITQKAKLYAIYGPKVALENEMSKEELSHIEGQQLVEKIKNLRKYSHDIYFYGPNAEEEVGRILNENFEFDSELIPTEKKIYTLS